jgi:hypothetical protein
MPAPGGSGNQKNRGPTSVHSILIGCDNPADECHHSSFSAPHREVRSTLKNTECVAGHCRREWECGVGRSWIDASARRRHTRHNLSVPARHLATSVTNARSEPIAERVISVAAPAVAKRQSGETKKNGCSGMEPATTNAPNVAAAWRSGIRAQRCRIGCSGRAEEMRGRPARRRHRGQSG